MRHSKMFLTAALALLAEKKGAVLVGTDDPEINPDDIIDSAPIVIQAPEYQIPAIYTMKEQSVPAWKEQRSRPKAGHKNGKRARKRK